MSTGSKSKIEVESTDLDIRDLEFDKDKVDVSGSTVAVEEPVTVEATDLDIRDLSFATDKVDVSGSEIDVNIQDQTTEAFFNRMCRALSGPYFLASNTVPDSYDIELVSAAGLLVGDDIGLFQNSSNPSSYFAKIKSISSNTITMDTPMDTVFDMVGNSPVLFELECDLAVDGSSTRAVFAAINDSDVPIDITRIILHMTDGTSMDDGKFGGIAALTNGCVLRKKKTDGTFTNYFNVKTNGEISEICYDKSYDDKAPSGVYGFSARLTFGGQSKVGVVIRLHKNEELQWLVQDNLTGLESFTIMAEGHFTDEV